ncbi:hypothetical protein DM450_08425 [Sphingomonas sp. IC081]|nr:hypothetical protein DM450_08425 [Sphingomonas sp. IC081]
MAAQLGEHILQVALDQFIAHGVEGANMDDIAAAANVSKRTLYSRYGSKTQLLIASAEHGTQRHLNPHSPSKSLILLSGSQYFRYKSWC